MTNLCNKCRDPKCKGSSIYDCCDLIDPKWMIKWMIRIKNNRKPYQSDFVKWVNQVEGQI